MPPPYTLRIARPTKSIPSLLPFYTTGLGFTVLSEFSAHAGFSGVILGHPNAPYHLEFTTTTNAEHEVRAPSEDNLLVFYIPDNGEWEEAVRRMRGAGFESVRSFNPWWEDGGVTFEDVDGWRVVLMGVRWGI